MIPIRVELFIGPNKGLFMKAIKKKRTSYKKLMLINSLLDIKKSLKQNINNLNERGKLDLIEKDPASIKKIKGKLNQKFLLKAIKESFGDCFRYIKDPSLIIMKAAINQNAYNIKYIKNPSEELQLLALKIVDGVEDILQMIENPTEKVMLKAIKDNFYNYLEIKNPSKEVQLFAIKLAMNEKDEDIITRYGNKFSQEVLLETVKYDSNCLEWIKNPSEEIQLIAVNQNAWTISDINYPSEKVQLAAIKQDPEVIEIIDNPTEAVQLESLKQDPDNIWFFRKPTEKAKLLAISHIPKYINELSNPSKELIKQAYLKDKNSVSIDILKKHSEKFLLELSRLNTLKEVLN